MYLTKSNMYIHLKYSTGEMLTRVQEVIFKAASFHVKCCVTKNSKGLFTSLSFKTHCKGQVKVVLPVDVILCYVVSVKLSHVKNRGSLIKQFHLKKLSQ